MKIALCSVILPVLIACRSWNDWGVKLASMLLHVVAIISDGVLYFTGRGVVFCRLYSYRWSTVEYTIKKNPSWGPRSLTSAQLPTKKNHFMSPLHQMLESAKKYYSCFPTFFFLKTHLTTSSIIQGGNQPSVSAPSTTPSSSVVEFYISLLWK